MKLQKADKGTKTTETKFTRGINIPPQSTIPKMPPVQPPKNQNK
jgi:hypothetical protein